jgi:hypothetical protein
MFRQSIDVACFIFMTTASASEFNIATGVSPKGDTVFIDGETYNFHYMEIVGQKKEVFNLREECNYDYDVNIFKCRKRFKSPLSGATYKRAYSKSKQDECGQPAEVFLCIAGCTPSIPKRFIVEPWEC